MTWTGAVSAATASTIALRDANANTQANNFIDNLTTTATAGTTTTLTVGSAYFQQFTGSTTQQVNLPDTSTLVVGQAFQIMNRSSGVVTVKTTSGTNLVQAMAASSQLVVTCTSIASNAAASWDAAYSSAVATGTVTSVAVATPNSLSVSGSPVTTSGTITLANRAINAQTADYTLTATDSTVTFDASGASRTATLPTAVGASGTVYVIKKIDSSTTNTVTLATTSAQTIDGIASGTLKLATQYESITVESDGANWLILDHKCDTSWTAYTPTCTGFGTVSNLSGQWMRSGDSIYIRVQFTAGTSTATEARVSLPYTSAGSPTIASIQLIGSWTLDTSFGAASTLLIETSVAYVTFGRQDGTDAGLTKIQGNGFPSSNQKMSLQSGPIPIANWFA
jgi:hypothetical protein